MHGLNSPLVAGVRTHIICRSSGARPTPSIMWSKGGISLRGATQTVSGNAFSILWIGHFTRRSINHYSGSFSPIFSQTSSDGNTTTSELVFQPAPEDNGKIITCSITTETLNGAAGLFLKDSHILDVRRTYLDLLKMDSIRQQMTEIEIPTLPPLFGRVQIIPKSCHFSQTPPLCP